MLENRFDALEENSGDSEAEDADTTLAMPPAGGAQDAGSRRPRGRPRGGRSHGKKQAAGAKHQLSAVSNRSTAGAHEAPGAAQ